MTTSTRSTSFLVIAALAAAGVLAFALPAFAQAATYAFVNQSGEVNAVVASDWMTAIATAPSIHPNSGVLLLNDQNSGILNK